MARLPVAWILSPVVSLGLSFSSLTLCGQDIEPALDEQTESAILAESQDDSSATSDAVTPITADDDKPETELIQERYPNRTIKLEREVTQDSHGNYVNHGPWRMYDEQGTLIAEGQYRMGERHGTWNRWFRGGEADLFSKAPYSQFTGPFVSQANFEDGKLNGKWTIYDSKQRKITQWDFAQGHRDGKAIWYSTNGKKLREVDYKDGEIDGQLLEWSADGNLTIKDSYQGGRKIATKTEFHSPGHKKMEGTFLFAREVLETPDDWWTAKLAVYSKQGKDERHGPWASWYASGQKQIEGEYQNDAHVGKFTWWHENGQRALEGIYDQGKQNGKWVWWYKNGQKSVQGHYVMGNPTGRWTWWDESGKVAQAADLSHSEGVVIESPAPAKEPLLSQPIPAPARVKFKR